MNPVQQWFESQDQFTEILHDLRQIVLSLGLEETYKWKQPVYMHAGKNILIISRRKDAAIISFFKGALLNDPQQILIKPGPNSHHSKYIHFKTHDELNQQEELVISLIKEAMLLSESGAQVEVEPSQKLGPQVTELNDYFAQDLSFAQAFQALTPGRQRAYLIHFSQAKQSSTRQKRIERYKARILAGKGFHDCVCGHSQKMPRCDGSHKHFPNSQLL